MSAPAQRAAEFLQTRAAKIQSQMLSMLAAKVSAGDPFDKATASASLGARAICTTA